MIINLSKEYVDTVFRPLHWAAYMGHVHIMELLLRHGADVHACDRNQYTPLHVVSARGNWCK